MNRDGTPETELEQFVFDSGLARLYLTSGYATEHSLTKAQVDELAACKFEPTKDELHKHVFDKLVYYSDFGEAIGDE